MSNANTGGPSFGSLALSAPMQANLQRLGYTAMTPIQAASLPLALAGHDLIAIGHLEQTQSKTLQHEACQHPGQSRDLGPQGHHDQAE